MILNNFRGDPNRYFGWKGSTGCYVYRNLYTVHSHQNILPPLHGIFTPNYTAAYTLYIHTKMYYIDGSDFVFKIK